MCLAPNLNHFSLRFSRHLQSAYTSSGDRWHVCLLSQLPCSSCWGASLGLLMLFILTVKSHSVSTRSLLHRLCCLCLSLSHSGGWSLHSWGLVGTLKRCRSSYHPLFIVSTLVPRFKYCIEAYFFRGTARYSFCFVCEKRVAWRDTSSLSSISTGASCTHVSVVDTSIINRVFVLFYCRYRE